MFTASRIYLNPPPSSSNPSNQPAGMKMNALDHYERLYGDLGLSPKDAAQWVFVSGWNAAMEEAMNQINTMPFGADTRASFAIYFQQMMHIDPNEIVKEKM